MIMDSKKLFMSCYEALCVVCVIFMVGYWLYKFGVDDRDIGTVDYKFFKDFPEIKYPVASLCFENPFMSEKMAELDLDIASYESFLKGDTFEKQFKSVDYTNLTLDLDNYLIKTHMKLRNETKYRELKLFEHKVSFNGFLEWGGFYKCFELALDKYHHGTPGNIKEIDISYNKRSLLQDIGKSSGLDVVVYLHYPDELVIAPNDQHILSIGRDNVSSLTWIGDVEILKRRDSRNRRCTNTNDMVSFDDMVRQKHTNNCRCILPYFRRFGSFPKCETKKSIKNALFNYQNARTEYYPFPCQHLSKLSYTVETEINDDFGYGEDYWMLAMLYPQFFRSIEMSKEVDVHSLVGNVGGYVGLFLGNVLT